MALEYMVSVVRDEVGGFQTAQVFSSLALPVHKDTTLTLQHAAVWWGLGRQEGGVSRSEGGGGGGGASAACLHSRDILCSNG